MNAVLLVVSVVAPLLPVVMFPTRFIGRGLVPTVMGAALIVGMMMLIYVGLSSLGGDAGDGKSTADADTLTNADVSALNSLFGG